MENLYFAVIPAKAGIQWLQVLRDPRRSLPPQSLGGGGDDGKLVFFDTRGRGNPGGINSPIYFGCYSISQKGHRDLLPMILVTSNRTPLHIPPELLGLLPSPGFPFSRE